MRRRSAASEVGLPQGPGVLLVLRPTVLRVLPARARITPVPLHTLRSIRCSQCRGASRPITLHTRQLLDSTAIYPFMSAVLSPPGCLRIRLRIPPSSSLSFKFSCGISGPADHPARGTRPSSRGSRVSMQRLARSQPSPSICWRNPERPVAATEARDAALTERLNRALMLGSRTNLAPTRRLAGTLSGRPPPSAPGPYPHKPRWA